MIDQRVITLVLVLRHMALFPPLPGHTRATFSRETFKSNICKGNVVHRRELEPKSADFKADVITAILGGEPTVEAGEIAILNLTVY